MKRNLLKLSMFIEQSYLHNPSIESTPQRDFKQCDVILVTSYLGLRSRSEKVKNYNVKFICYIESD